MSVCDLYICNNARLSAFIEMSTNRKKTTNSICYLFTYDWLNMFNIPHSKDNKCN